MLALAVAEGSHGARSPVRRCSLPQEQLARTPASSKGGDVDASGLLLVHGKNLRCDLLTDLYSALLVMQTTEQGGPCVGRAF